MKRQNKTQFTSKKFLYNHSVYHAPKEEYFYNHSHQKAELLFLIKGDCAFVIEGTSYQLHPFDMVFVPPFLHHYVHLNEENEYERIDLMFDQNLLSAHLKDKLQSTCKVLSLKEVPLLKDVFLKMDYYVTAYRQEDVPVLLKGMITEILYGTMYQNLEQIQGEKRANDALEHILEYINEHIMDIKSLDMVCENLYISKSYLHKCFKKHMRTTPKNYITQKRLNMAHQMILSGEKPVKVAQVCGFSDYTTFFRNYKAKYGLSPKTKDSV